MAAVARYNLGARYNAVHTGIREASHRQAHPKGAGVGGSKSLSLSLSLALSFSPSLPVCIWMKETDELVWKQDRDQTAHTKHI